MAAASRDPSRLKRIPKPAPPRVIRWFQERPSPYPHEQEALDHIRELMPPAEPFRAWATFCFTAGSGRVNECDLLILVPRGLFLLELKAHSGRLVNNGGTWNFHYADRVRTLRNPLHLTEMKARELKDRLVWAAKASGSHVVIPRVEAAVFLSARDLRSELDEQQRINVYGRNDRDTGLPRIWDDLLALPPKSSSETARRELFRFAQLLPDLMKKIGVSASTAHLRFDDDWELSKSPIDGGPTWEDRLAVRQHPIREEGRVRIYLVGDQADEKARRAVERAAEREYQVLQGINHRGIVQALQFRDHRGCPAILFRHRSSDLRLDSYLDTYGTSLSLADRLNLVRQLAEALRYAHDRSLYHRALAARSVYVSCRDDGSRPVLRVTDWQVAARDFDTTPLSPVGRSSLHSEHVADAAEVYLAPEFDQRYADPGDLDLFGLGAVAYLVLTGRPPAANRSELLQRLRVDGGLRPQTVADEVPDELNDLVFSVTRADVADRLTSVAAFLEKLDAFEQQRTAVEQSASAGVDPLEVLPGQQVADGWTVERVLGTGATSRVLLVRAEVVTPEGEMRSETRVLKVALDEGARAARLRDEAEALEKVGGGRVVRLIDGPRQMHGRTVLLLEYAGERSLGERLRSEGRLTYHELARFGDDLFVALDQLAGQGVRHRDIKPDNLGLFRRADRSWELKLFDFSLTKASDENLRAGTPGYVDPFLGADPRRSRYDDHAEWYAAAMTLHEMASGERPRWGDETANPAMRDDEVPTLAVELFDPALRPGLVEFFERALHRDAHRRFEDLRQMREAWRKVFATADATAPPSTPATVDASPSVSVEEARDRAAEAAELDTPLGAAGLSPAAESAAHQLGATTVGELLEIPPHLISRARGTGTLVRRELNRRHRQWRTRLGQRPEQPASAAAPHATADQAGEAGAGRRLGVEELAALVAPEPEERGRRPEAVRLLLGLPAADGSPSPLAPWCTQLEVAERLGVKQPTVSTYHRGAIERWAALPELREVCDELVEHVRAAGGVVVVEELAAELRMRRGTREGADDPWRVAALASAVVRAALDTELWEKNKDEENQPRLAVLRRGGRVFVAAESLPGTADPVPADLADYAQRLGEVATRLVAADPLPDRSAVLRNLRQVPVPEGMAPLADTRLVALAAAVSGNARYSPRLELYPKDLGLVRALRISQAAAGVLPGHGVSAEELLARIRSRFPDLELGEPTRMEVQDALREAGFSLEYDPQSRRFLPPAVTLTGSGLSSLTTGRHTDIATDLAVTAAAAGRDPVALLEEQLGESLRRGGFLALTLRGRQLPGVAELLAAAYPLTPVDLGAVFLGELRRIADERGQWEAVLRSDARFAASGELSRGLRSYVRAAWQRTEERLRERVAEAGPRTVLLLHNAGLTTRYADAGGHALLTGWQNAARRSGADPHGLWLLCPTDAPQAAPRLDGRIVEVLGDHERAVLREDFLSRLAENGSAAA